MVTPDWGNIENGSARGRDRWPVAGRDRDCSTELILAQACGRLETGSDRVLRGINGAGWAISPALRHLALFRAAVQSGKLGFRVLREEDLLLRWRLYCFKVLTHASHAGAQLSDPASRRAPIRMFQPNLVSKLFLSGSVHVRRKFLKQA